VNAERALQNVQLPDETGAELRAWHVVRSAYADRAPVRSRTRSARIAVLIPALILAALGVALTPAGASVRRWINAALGIPRAAPALFKLPAAGRLLVTSPSGVWSVAADGAARRLGSWRQASWSPRGLYVAVSSATELAAIDPLGTVRWQLGRPDVSDARWFSPSGYRIAYLSRRTLRVVAGDGTGDHLLASAVDPVAPAWRPGHSYELSYITAAGTLVTTQADTGAALWRRPLPARARVLAWAANGRRLLVLAGSTARIYDGRGDLVETTSMTSSATDAPVVDASLSPDGDELAVVRGGSAGDVELTDLSPDGGVPRRVLSVGGLRQVAWSPDGRWLLVSLPRADQWVFVRISGVPRIDAVSRIAKQFGGGTPAGGFPQISGWCCAH
jgi:hypothetical protein